MALVGRLEDLGLTELFHLLSLYQKSGKLTINENNKNGVFLFRCGKLVHAANGRSRKPLGDLLLEQGLISPSTLDSALQVQRKGVTRRKVGSILIEMKAITTEILEKVIGEQLREITEEFLHCKDGFFNFRPLKESQDTTDSSAELALDSGVNSDQFILELLTRFDEVGKSQRSKEISRPQQTVLKEEIRKRAEDHSEDDLRRLLEYMVDPKPYNVIDDLESRLPTGADDLASLRSLMVELQLRSPTFTGEITLMILRFATRLVNRGVLFAISPEGISGVGQFGLLRHDGVSADQRIREIMIPAHEPSVFFEVVEMMHTYRGRLKACRRNDELSRQLGGGIPNEVVAVPIIVDGLIVAVFLGDNLPDDHPIGSIQGLEILMIEAGLAMERKLLRARLNQAEKRVWDLKQELAHDDGASGIMDV